MVGDEASKKASQLFVGLFRLPISLRMVARRKAGRGPNQVAESFPEPGGELGAPIKNDVLGEEAMQLDDMFQKEFDCPFNKFPHVGLIKVILAEGKPAKVTRCTAMEKRSTKVRIVSRPSTGGNKGRCVTRDVWEQGEAQGHQQKVGGGFGLLITIGGNVEPTCWSV